MWSNAKFSGVHREIYVEIDLIKEEIKVHYWWIGDWSWRGNYISDIWRWVMHVLAKSSALPVAEHVWFWSCWRHEWRREVFHQVVLNHGVREYVVGFLVFRPYWWRREAKWWENLVLVVQIQVQVLYFNFTLWSKGENCLWGLLYFLLRLILFIVLVLVFLDSHLGFWWGHHCCCLGACVSSYVCYLVYHWIFIWLLHLLSGQTSLYVPICASEISPATKTSLSEKHDL